MSERLRAFAERMHEAVCYAHNEGFEWPSDPFVGFLDYWADFDAACDRDAAEGGDADAAPVPQDQQARPEGIAHE